MKNVQAWLASKKTTLIGLIKLIVPLLIMFGVIDAEAGDTVTTGAEAVYTGVEGLTNELLAIWLVIDGMANIFSRDADKSSEQSGVK